MIEKVLLDYLGTALSVPVYMEVPEEPPERYVLLEKTGGSRENHIESATFAIQSYAESLYEAAGLNERVKETMDGIAALDSVFSSKRNADYNFTDTAKKKYRYQAVYNLTY